MPTNDRAHKQGKASTPNQKTAHDSENLSELQQQTHPASIIPATRFDPNSLSASDVMQLQRTLGNKAVEKLLAQNMKKEKKPKELTTQQDIYSREGAYKPGSKQGLINHELDHKKHPSRRVDKPNISANNNAANVVQRIKEGRVGDDKMDHWVSDDGTGDWGRAYGEGKVSREKAQQAEKRAKSKERSSGMKGLLARGVHKVAKKVGLEHGTLEEKRNRARAEKRATVNATSFQKHGTKMVKGAELTVNAGLGLTGTALAPVTGGASVAVAAAAKQGVTHGAKKVAKWTDNNLEEAKQTGYGQLSDNEEENDTPNNLKEQAAEHEKFVSGPRSSGRGGGHTMKNRAINALGRTARIGAEVGASMLDPTGLGAKAAVGAGALAVDTALEEGSDFATGGKANDYGKLQGDDD